MLDPKAVFHSPRGRQPDAVELPATAELGARPGASSLEVIAYIGQRRLGNDRGDQEGARMPLP